MIIATDKEQAIYQDFHTHTTFCDGKNSPEEMVLSAIDKGLKVIGIGCHSLTEYPQDKCINLQTEPVFCQQVNALKVKYADKIKVYCGIEMDYHTNKSVGKYDYVIGSSHFFKRDKELFYIDKSKDDFIQTATKLFDGDYYKLSQEYYENVSCIVEKTNCDIIGHIDLITKFNQDGALFDETDYRYVCAYKKAIDKLVKFDKPFEINTGVISRGYKTAPYPSLQILDYIKSKGGKLVLSSDSHSKENIAYQYDKWKELL